MSEVKPSPDYAAPAERLIAAAEALERLVDKTRVDEYEPLEGWFPEGPISHVVEGEAYWDVDHANGGWVAHCADENDAQLIAVMDPLMARALAALFRAQAYLMDGISPEMWGAMVEAVPFRPATHIVALADRVLTPSHWIIRDGLS